MVIDPILREMVDNALSVSTRILKEGGELVPMFHVGTLRPEQTLNIIAAPFHGATLAEANRTKDAAAFQVAKLAKETGAEFVFMVSEAWGLPPEYSEEYVNNRDKYPEGISSHPNKIEIVSVTIETRQGSWAGRCAVTRGETGVEVGPLEIHQGKTTGRFSHLLI